MVCFNLAIPPRPIKDTLANLGMFPPGWIRLTKPDCKYDLHCCLSPGKKSKILSDPFQRYWWSKNFTIWLDESIFAYNLSTRIFPDIGISQENREL